MFAISLCPFVSPFLGHNFSSLEVTSPLVCNCHFLYSFVSYHRGVHISRMSTLTLHFWSAANGAILHTLLQCESPGWSTLEGLNLHSWKVLLKERPSHQNGITVSLAGERLSCFEYGSLRTSRAGILCSYCI